MVEVMGEKSRTGRAAAPIRRAAREMGLVLVLLAGVAGAAGVAEAQTGTVRGTVRGEGGEPVPGAAVTVAAYELRAVTDSAGNFVLRDVPAGAVRITVRRIGFRDAVARVTVRAGQVTVVNVVLVPDVVTLAPIGTPSGRLVTPAGIL